MDQRRSGRKASTDDQVMGVVATRRASAAKAGAVFVGAGLIGVAALWAWRARRPVEVTYPPLDVPKPIADQLWIVDSGPLAAMGLRLPIRMTVIRLSDGGLLLHSPTRFTPELAAALEELGPVRHIVAPNVAHWMFVADWQRAYPDATTWAVPALGEREQVRRSGLRIDAHLAEEAPAPWAGEIRHGIVRGGGGFEEAWLFHEPSRTLLLTDMIENLQPAKLPPLTALLMQAALATRATTALHVRAVLRLGGAPARADIRSMLATEPALVVIAHGAMIVDHPAEHLRDVFAWAERP